MESSSTQELNQLLTIIKEALREQRVIEEHLRAVSVKTNNHEAAVGDSYMLHLLQQMDWCMEKILNKKA